MAGSIHPNYLTTIQTIVEHQNIEIVVLPTPDGVLPVDSTVIQDASVLVIQQPNFYGQLEQVDELTNLAHEAGMSVIGVVNPLTLACLNPPGQWGEKGADIACGDGQPLGIPMASGGPSFGFLCTRLASVRQLPGRIAGKTVDDEDRPGFVLTLQAREQHIRREKATSNICTNQGLLVTAATVYMSLLGPHGLKQAASKSYAQTHELVDRLLQLEGVRRRFSGPFFHECVLDFAEDTDQLSQRMLDQGILAGLPLSSYLPNGERSLLVCATERRSTGDLDGYLKAFANV